MKKEQLEEILSLTKEHLTNVLNKIKYNRVVSRDDLIILNLELGTLKMVKDLIKKDSLNDIEKE